MTTTVNAVAHPARTARGFTVAATLLTSRSAAATTARSARGFTAQGQVKKLAVVTATRSARGFSLTPTVFPRFTRNTGATTSRGRSFAMAPQSTALALSATSRPRSFTVTPTAFTSISVTVTLPTFTVARSMGIIAPVVSSGRGSIIRWTFEDPANGNELWTVPMNPNKMTSPYVKHNTTTTATSPITGQASGIRTPDVAVEWQFSGSLNTEAHYNQLVYWVAKPNPIYITDHLGRKWYCYLTKFDPATKGTSPTNQWRYTYTVSALVFGRVGEPLA